MLANGSAAGGLRRRSANHTSAAIARAPRAARLQAMARAYLRFAQANRATYGLMFGKRPGVDRTPHATSAAFAAWSQLEREVMALAGPQKATMGSLHVWSSCHGFAMLLIDQAAPPQIDPDQAVEALTRMVIAGLQSDT